ncbi:hypothetical protein A1Q1_04730 [Trichosporon asahii var. asahii CBS 2479]|uniref:Uncharacterized protein n=1 Tax=Trichosporon asahii var. asahii (strain ATCC 90039 / CBS 2479 / JCM 2466 / KCTC 7840 / NBRC 103889/ NCYC 2677 / UAMH 7654) TaxID=1186058 RepID=J6EQB1_TRIAS|nr:hypothetical protein A1Q1_04730 [Trichosporon asahii var. asahii CBS 2479]EJT46659.1 hypothetical protein A1Q1_04730 [Trichosporon asahii var. asahii CBS 2479]
MLLSTSLSFAVLSALASAQKAGDKQPTLKFNRDLSPHDAQIRLGPQPEAWTASGSGDDTVYNTDSSWGQMTVNLKFIGDAITIHGKSDKYWTQSGGDWKSILYVTGTGGQFPTDGKILEQPLSSTDIAEFKSNDTREIDVSLVLGQSDWTISGVTVGTGFVSDAKSKDDARKTEVDFLEDGKVNPVLGTEGTWEASGEYAVCKDKSKFRTSIPKGVAYVELEGARGPESKEFQLHIFADDGEQIWETIATEFPTATESLFFFSPLDPAKKWTLEVDCIGPNIPSGQNQFDKITYYYEKTAAPADEEKPAAGAGSADAGDKDKAAASSTGGASASAGQSSSAAAAPAASQTAGAASTGSFAGLFALGAAAAAYAAAYLAL